MMKTQMYKSGKCGGGWVRIKVVSSGGREGDGPWAYSSSLSSRPFGGFCAVVAEVQGLECCGMELGCIFQTSVSSQSHHLVKGGEPFSLRELKRKPRSDQRRWLV
jgi:hypothetical protein